MRVVFTARCYAERGYATVRRLSVYLYVCLWRSGTFFAQVGNWNTSKFENNNYTVERLNVPAQILTPNIDDLVQREHTRK